MLNKEIEKGIEVIAVRNDGMLGIPFLKLKVIEEKLYSWNYTLLHKKTDTQSYDNRVSV